MARLTDPQTYRARRASRDAWIMLAILIVFYILNVFDRSVLSLMVGHAKIDLGVSDSQIGLLLGIAFALFYGICGIPIGILVDRYSRRLVLFGGVVFWSLATVLCAFAGTFGQLLGARMLLGAGEAALMPAAHSLMADKFPKAKLSTALSLFYLGGSLGNSLSVVVGGMLVAHFGQFSSIDLTPFPAVRGWQMPFLLVGLLGAGLAMLSFAFREPARAEAGVTPAAAEATSWRELARERRAMLLVILGSYVVHSMVLYAVLMWTPAHMARTFGWTPAQIGAGYGIVHIVGTGIGTLVAGMVADRVLAAGRSDAPLRVFIVSQIVAWPIGIAAFWVSDPYLFLVLECAFFFIGLSYAGYAAATVQAIAPPGGRGRMAAVYLLLLTIVGVGLGPWFVGLLTDHLFGDPDSVGSAIILMMTVITPFAVLVAVLGLAPMRAAASAQAALHS